MLNMRWYTPPTTCCMHSKIWKKTLEKSSQITTSQASTLQLLSNHLLPSHLNEAIVLMMFYGSNFHHFTSYQPPPEVNGLKGAAKRFRKSPPQHLQTSGCKLLNVHVSHKSRNTWRCGASWCARCLRSTWTQFFVESWSDATLTYFHWESFSEYKPFKSSQNILWSICLHNFCVKQFPSPHPILQSAIGGVFPVKLFRIAMDGWQGPRVDGSRPAGRWD